MKRDGDIASIFWKVAAKKYSASSPSVPLTDPVDIGPLVQSTNASTSENNVILEDIKA
jgi:hypothetical protein